MLGREGADDRTRGQLYLAVVQSVMLYRSETRVMTPHIGRVLSGFLHRVSHSIMGRQPRQGSNGMWKYPPPEDAMAEA